MGKHLARGLLLLFAIVGVRNVCVAQKQSREEIFNRITEERAELQKLEGQFLAPSADDQTNYAEFLRQPDTGLIRLLPREVFDTYGRKDKRKALTILGGGAYYSFTRLTHDYGLGTDLSLDSNFLKVGFAGANYGMLVNLGDIPLEQATLEHAGARFLAQHDSAADEPQARIEQRRFQTGFAVDGFNYRDRLPLAINSTYLLRSVFYSESDVLVAFRVVRLDIDSSIIIAWRMLKKFPKPELRRMPEPVSAVSGG